MRRPWLLAAALAAAAVAVTAVALVRDSSSSEATPVGFPNTPEGRRPMIFDIGSMIYLPDQPRANAMAEIRSLGADALRVPVLWNVAAPAQRPAAFDAADPTDPHYNWAPYDAALRTAQSHGLRILLMPTGPAPEWAAKPGGGGVVDPDPQQFGQFVTALAKRYSGHFKPQGSTSGLPAVDIWTIWNEPNLSTFLRPQRRAGRPYSPLLYRKLYLAGQAAIEAQDRGTPILIGETAPTGGEESVDPLTFTRQTLCLNGDFNELPGCPQADQKIDAVGWSAHPYPLAGQPPFATSSNPHFVP